MAQLKEKKRHVTGRCATCRWLDICGGNFRVRAEASPATSGRLIRPVISTEAEILGLDSCLAIYTFRLLYSLH